MPLFTSGTPFSHSFSKIAIPLSCLRYPTIVRWIRFFIQFSAKTNPHLFLLLDKGLLASVQRGLYFFTERVARQQVKRQGRIRRGGRGYYGSSSVGITGYPGQQIGEIQGEAIAALEIAIAGNGFDF